jgi:hypothetical protein
VSHDRVRVMLDALLAVPAPDGYTIARRDRYDPVLDHTFQDVTISPPGVDVSTFGFGTPGAYAHISVDDGGDTYIVGVFANKVAYHVQGAGHVVHFTAAADAVQRAVDELRGELLRQERGW